MIISAPISVTETTKEIKTYHCYNVAWGGCKEKWVQSSCWVLLMKLSLQNSFQNICEGPRRACQRCGITIVCAALVQTSAESSVLLAVAAHRQCPVDVPFTAARTTCNWRAVPKHTLGKLELCSKSLEEQGKKKSDKYPVLHVWEINPPDLYGAECSCFANGPLWFLHWAR